MRPMTGDYFGSYAHARNKLQPTIDRLEKENKKLLAENEELKIANQRLKDEVRKLTVGRRQ